MPLSRHAQLCLYRVQRLYPCRGVCAARVPVWFFILLLLLSLKLTGIILKCYDITYLFYAKIRQEIEKIMYRKRNVVKLKAMYVKIHSYVKELSMKSFECHMTTDILFGMGQEAALPDRLKGYGKKILLTYGGGSIKRNGLYDKLMALLSDFEIFERR